MLSITEALRQIKNAVLGRDVRTAIHDGIQQCYNYNTDIKEDLLTAVTKFKTLTATQTVHSSAQTGPTPTYIAMATFSVPEGSTAVEASYYVASNGGYWSKENLTVSTAGTTISALLNPAEADTDYLFRLVYNVNNPDIISHEDELEDIRVGEDGTEYSTAGEAVRTQIGDLKDDLNDLEEEVAAIEPGLSDAAKTALLNCFQHVAWIDEHGQDYYDALEYALYAGAYPRITVQFNPGLNVIYTDDTLDSLKQYLTVKYYETKESTGTVIAPANYSLSGSLIEGASTVFVSYSGLTTSFIVDGVVDFYNIWEWRYPSDNRVLLLDQKSPSVYNPTGQYSTLGIYEYSDSIRMMGAVNRGVLPYMHRLEVVFYDGLYPIPIPKEATSVTISAVPSALQISATVSRYIESENRYEQVLNNPGGWQTQPKTFTFDAAQNLFLSMSFRNASNTAMTDSEKPTAYAIEFA